jgi:hypothetical protein
MKRKTFIQGLYVWIPFELDFSQENCLNSPFVIGEVLCFKS